MAKGSRVYFLVGIPGSGKSTWSRKLNATVLSSDNLREELLKNSSGPKNISLQELFKILDNRAEQLLRKKERFTYDATNIEPNFRRAKLKKWKEQYQASIYGVVFLTNLETAHERNAARENPVNPPTIDYMWKQFVDNPIDTNIDLFDKIIGVDDEGNEDVLYDKEKRPEGLEAKISPKEFTPYRPGRR